jgi:hypothetical protein
MSLAARIKKGATVIHFRDMNYGFEYGALCVTRIHSDSRGGVMIQLNSHNYEVQVYVTATGRMKISDGTKEIIPNKKKKIKKSENNA